MGSDGIKQEQPQRQQQPQQPSLQQRQQDQVGPLSTSRDRLEEQQQQHDQVRPFGGLIGEGKQQGRGGMIMSTDAGGCWNCGGEGLNIFSPD